MKDNTGKIKRLLGGIATRERICGVKKERELLQTVNGIQVI